MQVSDKKLRTMKALLARVQAGKAGGTDSELDTAEILLKAMLEKYGLSERDISNDSSTNEINLERVHFVPNLSEKKNPAYFRVLINRVCSIVGTQVITYNERLGAIVIGVIEKINETIKHTEYALKRGHDEYEILASGLTKKVLKEKDFKLGFAEGFYQALIEKQLKESEANQTDEEKRENEALIVISKMLAAKQASKKDINSLKDEGKANDQTEDLRPKNRFSFNMGVMRGLQAFDLFLTASK